MHLLLLPVMEGESELPMLVLLPQTGVYVGSGDVPAPAVVTTAAKTAARR